MKIDAKNQSRSKNRKRNWPDADEASGEEEASNVAAEKTAKKKPKIGDKGRPGSHVADEDSDDLLIAAHARLGLKSRKGKQDTRKRYLSDEESGEDGVRTVAAGKTTRKKPKIGHKGQSVAGEDSDDFLIAAYARLGLKARRGKRENRKRRFSNTDQESEEEDSVNVAAEKTVARKKAKKGQLDHSDEDEEKKAGTKQSKSDKRDRRTLVLNNLPGDCTARQIKALSNDMKHVRLKSTLTRIDDKKHRISYAYVSFASEEVAEKNFKLLDGKEFNGTIISVDYVGSKSQFITTRPKTEPEEIDPLRLHLSSLPGNATEDDIQMLFPEAVEIELPMRKKDKLLLGYAFVRFNDAALTSKYHDLGQDLVLHGNKLVVLYARHIKSEKKKRRKRRHTQKVKENIDPLRLHLKSLPGNATEGDIQKLFPEAVEIELPMRKKDKLLLGYAFVRFNDPALTSKYHGQGQDLVLHGNKLVVIYAKQTKSENREQKQMQKENIDALRLHLRDLPGNATEDDIQKLFPEAVEIELPMRKKDKLLLGYAFVRFNDPALTSKYHDLGQDLVLHGNTLVVLYARQRKSEKKKKQTTQQGEEDGSKKKEVKIKMRKRDDKEGPAAKRAQAVHGDTKITLYIGNLNKNTAEDDLSKPFSEISISVAAVCKQARRSNGGFGGRGGRRGRGGGRGGSGFNKDVVAFAARGESTVSGKEDHY